MNRAQRRAAARRKPNVDPDHMRAHAKVWDRDMNLLDEGPLDEVTARLTAMPPQPLEVEVGGKRWALG